MIRDIQLRDAQDLEYICRTSLGHDTTAALLEKRIEALSHNDNYRLLVYENGSGHQVLGFIQAEKYNLLYGEDGWNIIALAVSPEARRQGIGRQLLSALEAQAVKEGYAFIRLNCNIIRTDAHAFYQQMGYTCDKTQKRFIKMLGQI